MQLGANKAATMAFPTELADEIDEDKALSGHLRSEIGDLVKGHKPWGTDDLIDVNADDDDWSKFNIPSLSDRIH